MLGVTEAIAKELDHHHSPKTFQKTEWEAIAPLSQFS